MRNHQLNKKKCKITATLNMLQIVYYLHLDNHCNKRTRATLEENDFCHIIYSAVMSRPLLCDPLLKTSRKSQN